MHVIMSREWEHFVNAQVANGNYPAANDVVYDALRLLADMEAVRRKRLESLNYDIQLGLDQAEQGKMVSAAASNARMNILHLIH